MVNNQKFLLKKMHFGSKEKQTRAFKWRSTDIDPDVNEIFQRTIFVFSQVPQYNSLQMHIAISIQHLFHAGLQPSSFKYE